MAKEIVMPRQGNTVESCLILEWKKQEGDVIQAGEVLCEVETDKAAFEVAAEESGTVLKILREAGADVPVLSPIAIIGEPGEDISGFLPQQAQAAPEPAKTSSVEHAPAASPIPALSVTSREGFGASPRARNLAAAKGVDVAVLTGTGPAGRVIERDVVAALSGQEPLTPSAIAAMVEQGLRAPSTGTGIGGRVTTQDLKAAQPSTAPVVTAVAEQPANFREIPVKGVRKIVAARMLESLQNTAQLTMNASADASALLAFRKRVKESPEALGLQGITINDMILYAVSRVLPQFSFMNAHFLGETMREFERVQLGMAVDAPRGLMVPVMKQADLLSLKALSHESKRLISACREGTILPDELTGGTFTITNLGAAGIESFTPVLNPPEVAILGVCAIQPKAVMVGEDVTFVPHIGLSLTFDHRAVDGAPAARFLKALSTAIANFDLLLAS